MPKPPSPKIDISSLKATNKVKGDLVIYLVHARDLPTVDGNGLDPLFKFSLGDKEVVTDVVKNKTMLEYKKEFKIPIELENPSELPNLVVKAYDYEMLG